MMTVQSILIDWTRFVSSPALYLRKNGAGSVRIRMISAASTFTEVFVRILWLNRPVTELIRFDATATQTIVTATLTSADTFPPESTGPVRAWVIRGISIPTSVEASVATTSSITSANERQFFMYRNRSWIPIDFCGSGL